MGVSDASIRKSHICCRVACFSCTLTTGLLFLLLGVWSTHLYQRFTPVFSDIMCEFEPPRLTNITFHGFLQDLHIELVTTTKCHNPNPYTVEVTSAHAGTVYMGRHMTEVASVTEVPHSVLPAQGTGFVNAIVNIAPTAELFPELFMAVITGRIPIYFSNNMEVIIDVNFLFGRFQAKKAFNKDCGMDVMLRTPGGASFGPLACAADFDKLKALPDGTEPELVLSAVNVADDEVEKGTQAKNIGLGTLMALGYGLGSILLCCGSACLFYLCRSRAESQTGDKCSDDPNPQSCDTRVAPVSMPSKPVPEEV